MTTVLVRAVPPTLDEGYAMEQQRWGVLDRASKLAIFGLWMDGKPLETSTDGVNWTSVDAPPAWDARSMYRVKTSKPSIDWAHVAPRFSYLAVDPDGTAWLYTKMPTYSVAAKTASNSGSHWATQGGDRVPAEGFASYMPGNCVWHDSQITRYNSR